MIDIITLKRKILEAGIKGKLIPQDPTDEPASLLLDKIKKEKTQPVNTIVNIEFDIPNTWVRAILRDVCFLSDGEKISGTTLPYLDAKYLRGKKNVEFRDNGKLIFKGEYAILVDGENSGEVFSIPEDGIMGSTFKKLIITPFMEAKFILYFLEYYRSFFRNNKKGAAIPHLNKELFAYTPIGIPPLEEQKRIVAKISEIFTVLDEIEKLQSKYSSNQDALKDKVLDAAIKGKLVPQDPNDEPASILLEKIAKEKEKLIKEGKIKKEKSLPTITEDEIPFEIPDSWEWVRLNKIVTLLGDGIHGTPLYDPKGNNYFINGTNIKNDRIIITDNTKLVSDEEALKHSRTLCDNTLLVSINGTLGNVAYYKGENIVLGKSVCYFNLLYVYKYYIGLFLKSFYVQEYLKKSATGSTIKNVPLSSMRSMLVPIPPIGEQKRIVAKIEELMPLIDNFNKA